MTDEEQAVIEAARQWFRADTAVIDALDFEARLEASPAAVRARSALRFAVGELERRTAARGAE